MADLNDASLAPSPEGGWSSSLTSVHDATIAPTEQIDMIQPCGVFDAAGAYIHQAVLWRGRPLMVPLPLPEVKEHLPGRWIWGGVLLNHFGHFLTESTGRLWAVDAVKGKVDGIVFIAKRDVDDENEGLQPFHKIFFDLLGLDIPIRVITKPTRADLLEVPGQGFGIGPLANGTEPFRRFMRDRFAKKIAPVGSERLYISRSELSSLRGGILEEVRLERYLATSGYETFHPQKHSLQDQVARYKAARQIVALDGSALHLFAMLGTAEQQVAVIKRRDSGASDSIVDHLSRFSGRAPLVLDTIRQDWIRSDRKRADRFSLGELDFAALGHALGKGGFIPADANWASLTADETAAVIKDIEAKLQRKKLTYHAIPRGGVAPQAAVLQAPPPPEKRNLRREERMARRAVEKASAGK